MSAAATGVEVFVVVLGSCWDPERFKQDADNLKYGARLKTLTTASRESHTALSVEKRLSGTTPLEFAAADRSRGYGQRHVYGTCTGLERKSRAVSSCFKVEPCTITMPAR